MYKILHIERSSFFRSVISDFVKKSNHIYIGCGTAEKAFEIMLNDQVDIILTGFELDDTNALDFMVKLNSCRFKDIPVAVITANDDIVSKEKMLSVGVTDFMIKSELTQERFSRFINIVARRDHIIASLQGMNVAVCDDSNLSLSVIKNILTFHGITGADYFTEPLDLISSKKVYSLYLIDLVMPHISGDDLIYKIREKNNDCVIITISGISNDKTIGNILMAGADDYIVKPFDATLLMMRIKNNVKNLLLIREIESQKKLLKELSEKDSLTKLYNHAVVLEKLQNSADRIDRNSGKEIYIAMLDIDNFKNVNDIYGHQIGDDVLIQISGLLNSCSSDDITVGRYDGEEFILFFCGKQKSDAFKTVDEIREKISMIQYSVPSLKTTVSGGLSSLTGKDIESAIKIADKLLYQAKNNGKNRIEDTLVI